MKMIKLLSTSMVLVALFVLMTACPKPDKGGEPTLVEDGVYLVGDATLYTEPKAEGLFFGGINETDGQPRASMFEKYAILDANKPFQVQIVKGTTTVKLGGTLDSTSVNPGGDFPNNANIDYYSPATDGTITVKTAGLYHIIYDNVLNKIVVVNAIWGVRGGMNSWGFTEGTKVADGKTKITFSWTDQALKGGEKFKFAYGGGWKIKIGTEAGNDVRANTNVGGAINALVPGGGDIPGTTPDKGYKYDISLTWTAATTGHGFSGTITQKGELQNTNWTEHKTGLRGETGFCPEALADSWGANLLNVAAVKTGEIYKWTITVSLKANKGFKVDTVDKNDANEGWIGFGTPLDGPNKDDLKDASGNFKVEADGTYELVLTIDASKGDSKTITVTKK